MGELMTNSYDKYIYDQEYNSRINEIQDTYKNRYDFMNEINTKINNLQVSETKLLTDSKNALTGKISNLQTAYYNDNTSGISNVNSDISTKSKEQSNLIKEYKYIRKNAELINYLKDQVAIPNST
jgi:hypothetical protein